MHPLVQLSEPDGRAPCGTSAPAGVPAGPALRRAACRLVTAALAFAVLSVAPLATGLAHAEKPVFQDPFDGHALQIPEAKTKTAAVERFKETGENAYVGDAAATGHGKALFDQWCQVCHNADGSGKMCPPLIGTDHIYPQMMNDPGMFSILYAGASGAMQSFANRMSQDDMLKVIAYVRTLQQARQ